MLLKRVLTAAVLLPPVVALIVWGDIPGTALVIALLAGVGVHEFLRFRPGLFSKREELAVSLWGVFIAALFASDSTVYPSAALATGVLVYALREGLVRGPEKAAMDRIVHVAAAWLYAAFSLGFALIVRSYGYGPVLFVVALVMVGDSAAYFVGTAMGKRRLAPKLSPKKSVEGAVASLIAAGLAGYGMAAYFEIPFAPAEGLLIALVLNVAAQAGDLAESLLKRAAGVKDSGTLFPGHGGVLDRVDAFLPVLPVFAAILTYLGG